MSSEADLFCDSLTKWLHTFPVKSKGGSTESLCDGVTMAQVRGNIRVIKVHCLAWSIEANKVSVEH